MKLSYKKLLLCLAIYLFVPVLAHSKCKIFSSDGATTVPNNDVFYLLISKSDFCPTNVQQLKVLLSQTDLKIVPAMVANRGINNPEKGSFSFFETVSGTWNNINVNKGEFFFGHFTGLTDPHQVGLDQSPEPGKLLIELIAWDSARKLFNFYELIGESTSARWFYRGNTWDILQDNTYLYREPPIGLPKFEGTLRCSACHSSGGPIMKELALPHNDWWTPERPLPSGSKTFSEEVQGLMKNLIPAEDFAQNVKNGIQTLENSSTYKQLKASLSLQEQLRPLFCEQEINLESNIVPNGMAKNIHIPSGFFLNPLLGELQISLSSSAYKKLLQDNQMYFPETHLDDADHAWLTPVKGYSDLLAIQSLIDSSVIDEHFVKSVLSADIAHPLFSVNRCSLLKLIPESHSNWKNIFIQNLKNSKLANAQELVQKLIDPTTQTKVESSIKDYSQSILLKPNYDNYYENLINLREQVFESEISQNPRGQILEPGFRVIFPIQKIIAH